MSGIKWTETTF